METHIACLSKHGGWSPPIEAPIVDLDAASLSEGSLYFRPHGFILYPTHTSKAFSTINQANNRRIPLPMDQLAEGWLLFLPEGYHRIYPGGSQRWDDNCSERGNSENHYDSAKRKRVSGSHTE